MLNIDDRLIKDVSPKIGPNALSTLLAIAIHLNQSTGRAFPSNSRLMQLTGLGRDAVYKALATLQENGLLKSIQSIDSKKKTFSRRSFIVSTKFISVFVTADQVEPLTENPYTANPYTADPYTANQETYHINNIEPINNLEQINNSVFVADAPTENQTVFSVEIFEPSKTEFLTLETENTKKKKAPAARRAKLPTPDGNDGGAAYLHSIGQTPTLQPYQSELTGDPVDLATEWMQINAEQVKIWQERAGTQFDNKRLKEEAVKYFAYYQAKHGPDHMANTRPMYFFQRSFGGWLMSAKHYNTPFSTGAPKKQAVNDARGIDYSRPQKF